MTYRCATCGRMHDDLPDVGSDRPYAWWLVPREERGGRIRLTPDTCVIDGAKGRGFYVRGVIELPIRGHPHSFGFGVWVSLKEENYRKYLAEFDSAAIGPFFGWLCTKIGFYEKDTLLLKTMIHFRGGGLRPSIEVEPTDHPLAVDQRKGIDLEKAWRIAHHYMALDEARSGPGR